MRELSTEKQDYVLLNGERENIIARAARIYRKGIAVRFLKWFFFFSAFFIVVLPNLSWNCKNVLDFFKLTLGLVGFLAVAIWQIHKIIFAFRIKSRLNVLDNSTLAIVFREVKRPSCSRLERWKNYLLSTAIRLIVTVCLDIFLFGLLSPFLLENVVEKLCLFLILSKLSVIIERIYEEKTDTDFYITSCHLF